MATHSSTVAWRIPWREEPGRLQSMGSQRVRHDWATLLTYLLTYLSIELVMPSNHLILCHPLLLLPSIFTSIRGFSTELALCIRWPKYSASVLPMKIQSWFSLGLTGLISLLSKGLSRVFSNTTIWKHQFFGAQPSLWSNSHMHTWLLEKPYHDYMDLCQQSDVSTL